MQSEYDTCIIGAGWSGLLACKYFKAAGFDPIVLERNDYIGGVWRHDPERITGGVLASTYTTSSKTVTEMSDFPMPDRFPDFPRHSQIMEYLQAYHDHFELGPHIRLGNGARRVEKKGERWMVEAEDGTIIECERVVVCAGVHQEATDSGRGQFAGFDGSVIHSTALETHLPQMGDKRVLIVGSGETASDAAAEISRLTPHLALSSPNGQWFVPRSSPLPVDPPFLLDHASGPFRVLVDPFDAAFWTAFEAEFAGGPCGSGVPQWQTDRPYQTQFFNKNPAPVQLWRDGQLAARTRVASVSGSTVSFVDGVADDYDIVVLCTGFETVFPFLPAPYDTRGVDTYFKLMLADDPSLSFVGFARPVFGSIPGIAELQARCLAAMYAGTIPTPGDREAVIARDRARSMERFGSGRLKGLVDMNQSVTELAVWLEAYPDYVELARERPQDAATLFLAPHHGARFWLHLPERRDAIVALLRQHTHPGLRSTPMWAFGLFMNTFPINAKRVFHRRRFMLLRSLVGYLGFPLYFPAAFLVYAPSRFATLVGLLLLIPLLPVLIWRLFAHKRLLREMARDFLPAPA